MKKNILEEVRVHMSYRMFQTFRWTKRHISGKLDYVLDVCTSRGSINGS